MDRPRSKFLPYWRPDFGSSVGLKLWLRALIKFNLFVFLSDSCSPARSCARAAPPRLSGSHESLQPIRAEYCDLWTNQRPVFRSRDQPRPIRAQWHRDQHGQGDPWQVRWWFAYSVSIQLQYIPHPSISSFSDMFDQTSIFLFRRSRLPNKFRETAGFRNYLPVWLYDH